MTEKRVTIKDVKEAVSIPGESLTDFGKEWRKLPEEDKEDLRKGVGNGSMTY